MSRIPIGLCWLGSVAIVLVAKQKSRSMALRGSRTAALVAQQVFDLAWVFLCVLTGYIGLSLWVAAQHDDSATLGHLRLAAEIVGRISRVARTLKLPALTSFAIVGAFLVAWVYTRRKDRGVAARMVHRAFGVFEKYQSVTRLGVTF